MPKHLSGDPENRIHMLAVSHLGMYTPVGLTGTAACAALRAGISRLKQCDLYDRWGEPISAARVPVESLPSPNHPSQRAAALAVKAFLNAIVDVSKRELDLLKISLSVGDPARMGAASDVASALRNTLRQLGVSPDCLVETRSDGHAGAVLGLGAIGSLINSDERSLGVVLGVDCLSNFANVEYFERHGRLRDSRTIRGLYLGEAAACAVIRSHRSGRRPLALIRGLAAATEPHNLNDDAVPRLAQGLTRALDDAVRMAGWGEYPSTDVYIDLNGEPVRTHEWMLASTRVLTVSETVHPADCIGDVGAAAAPLLLGMAATALHRKYARTTRAVVCTSSDSGARGVVCLEAIGA